LRFIGIFFTTYIYISEYPLEIYNFLRGNRNNMFRIKSIKKALSICMILIFVLSVFVPATAIKINRNISLPFDEQIIINDFHYKKIVSGNVTETVTHFYGESNASIYIVTVESQSDITLVDGCYTLTLRSNGTQNIDGYDFGGGWVTNGTVLVPFPKCGDEMVFQGELRYFHIKFGKIINYTYDKRRYQEYQHNQSIYGFGVNLDKNYTDFILPAGKWHFIFTALPFNLEQDDVLPNYKVCLNFSGDLKISTSEGGKIYALYYPEYDANLAVSKSWTFEYMLNGKASFNIENTFVYEFMMYPRVNGFWSIKWNTPDGIKNFNMIMIKKKLFYNENKVEGCVFGVGENGYYEFSTSSIDYDPEMLLAYAPIFFGFDVKLQ